MLRNSATTPEQGFRRSVPGPAHLGAPRVEIVHLFGEIQYQYTHR